MARFSFDPDLIRELAALLRETGLSEIEIGEGETRIRVARTLALHAAAVEAPIAPAQHAGELAPTAAEPEETLVASPMVGTAYLAPEPGAESFVKAGDEVREGDTLMIIEAMKTMNPIRAPRSGRVKRVLVANGAAVEFGEPLVALV